MKPMRLALFNKGMLNVVICSLFLMPLAVVAETYYWTGGANESVSETDRTPSMETASNWALPDGTVATVAPGKDDDIIFTNKIASTIWSDCKDLVSSSRRLMTYRTITLKEEGDVSISAPSSKIDGRSCSLGLPTQGLFNYTDNGTLKYETTVKPYGSKANPTTYRVHIENPDASFIVGIHNNPEAYTTIIKTGAGLYQVLGSTASCGWYASNPEFYELVGGTLKFPQWLKSGYNSQGATFTIKGDDPKCLALTKPNGYYGITCCLKEESVTKTTHMLTDEGNGATLAFTNCINKSANTLKDCRFTGILAGTLSIEYDVKDWIGEDPRSELTLAKGTSTSTGKLTVRCGTVNVTERADYSSLSSVSVESNGRLSVSDGAKLNVPELKLAEGGELALGEDVVVQVSTLIVDGSACASGFYTKNSGVGITGEGVVFVAPVMTVAYTSSTRMAEPLDLRTSVFTHEMVSRLSTPLGLALSEAIAVPDHELNKILVARFSADSGLIGDDFEDHSPKTYGLPYTWFETEVEDGETRLYLCSRPVIEGRTLDRLAAKTAHYFMRAAYKDMWSDNQVPHPGADYLLRGTGSKTSFRDDVENGEKKFPGESLTLAGVYYDAKNRDFEINLRCYDMTESSADWYGLWVSTKSVLRGEIYLGDTDTTRCLDLRGDSDCQPEILSAVSGPGRLCYSSQWSASTNVQITVGGDNSRHMGCVKVRSSLTSSVWHDMTLVITNANALGGALTSPEERGLELTGFAALTVNDTTVFEAKNRNIYLENGLRLKVAEGKTFAIKNPVMSQIATGVNADKFIPNRCFVEKTGAGTFALGASVTPCVENEQVLIPSEANGKNNLVRIVEGGVQPLTATAFDNLQLDFADGTAVVVDPANIETQNMGLRVLTCAPRFVDGAMVMLRIADGFVPEGNSFSVAFLTVPEATPDLQHSLSVARYKTENGNFSGRLVKESVTVDGIAMTRYSAHYGKGGLIVIFK